MMRVCVELTETCLHFGDTVVVFALLFRLQLHVADDIFFSFASLHYYSRTAVYLLASIRAPQGRVPVLVHILYAIVLVLL